MKEEKYPLIAGLFLVVALLFFPTYAGARVWFALEGGPDFMENSDLDVAHSTGDPFFGSARDLRFDRAFLGGATLGYDFVRDGFLGQDYHDWMKRFSFAVDFTYNTLSAPDQSVPFNATGGRSGTLGIFGMEGRLMTLSFLFMYRYGFLQDADVPFGRLQPYVAAGPGILFSRLEHGVFTLGPIVMPNGRSSSRDLGLVLETGIRYMARSNISLDLGLRYRTARPDFNFNVPGIGKVKMDLDIDTLSLLGRAAYHF